MQSESEVLVTDAEERGEMLNPWVQWVTVHTGLSLQEHQVTTLSQGHLVSSPAVWDLVTAAGGRVWVCGSMNCRYDRPLNGFLLPDPWSTGVRAFPEQEFTDYLSYVRGAVQDHTSQSAGGGGSTAAFLKFMAKHGLSASTVFSIAAQLISEKFSDTKWKRAAILDLFQWDLFRYYYHKQNPHLATFFINSTAHF
ncbi:MAG: hypothetical protein ACKOU6_07750, partial [Planctomycetota bacterium]